MKTTDQTYQKFLEDYRRIRHAEGRGSDKSEYYRALPECDPKDPNAPMWAMRAKTYSHFVGNALEPLELSAGQPLDILDLGAGNCWLSNRLSERGHRVAAVDIFVDQRDGLRAAHHYSSKFRVIEASFDDLPLPSRAFDLAIFNASFHYSVDYERTLAEVQRVLRPTGSFALLDTPIYKLHEHGLQMVEEKHARFFKRYGFRSDALPSIGFLDIAAVQRLQKELGIHWQVLKPWYGTKWHLRPLKPFLLKRRPPSRFWIFLGRFQSR